LKNLYIFKRRNLIMKTSNKKQLFILIFTIAIGFCLLFIGFGLIKNLQPSVGKCVLPSPFNCSINNFTSTGYLTITIQQNSGKTIRINRIACLDNESMDTNIGLPKPYVWTNLNIDLPSNSSLSVGFQCKTSTGTFKMNVGSQFSGILAINYTSEGIMRYQAGTIVARVTNE